MSPVSEFIDFYPSLDAIGLFSMVKYWYIPKVGTYNCSLPCADQEGGPGVGTPPWNLKILPKKT